MAETKRERIIANPGRRRRNKARRSMSDKQIAIFGSPAQKAALARRRSRARKRNAGGTRKSHRRRNNAGEIIGYTLANPAGRKRGKMARTKANRKRSNAGKAHHHAARSHRKRSHHHRTNRRNRMNPGRRRHRRNAVGVGGVGHIVTNAIFVIAGALGSKLLTQLVLGSNNVGLIGYAGNAVAGGLLWFVTEKVMRNRVASEGVIAGTAVQIILRLINDYTPFGQYVSSLGMGDYQAQSFVTPQVLVDPYNSAQIRIPGAWLPPPPPPASVTGASKAAGVSGFDPLYGGRSGLY